MLTTPSARLTAINFLARRLPKLNGEEGLLLVSLILILLYI